MAKSNKLSIQVEGKEINLQTINERDYLSLSDMAKEEGGIERIRNWMRNRDTIEFLATWEQIHNPDFNVVQMHHITKDVGFNRFIMSPKNGAKKQEPLGWLQNKDVMEEFMVTKILLTILLCGFLPVFLF